MWAAKSSICTTILLVAGFGSILFFPTDGHSTFHLWEINEIYSNANGTHQFIELTTAFDGQNLVAGHEINATSDGNTKTFTFGNNSTAPTINHSLLLVTPALAALSGFPSSDFTIQSNFFEPTANTTTIDFIGADIVTINGGIPIDGLNSVDDSGTIMTASPTNYNGATASPPFTNPFALVNTTFTDSFSVAAQDTGPQGVAFSTDGTKMFVVGFAGDAVYEYTLGTAFDVSTGNFTGSFSVAAQDTIPTGVAFSTDGTKMFVVGFAGDAVYEYTLGTAFDVSTTVFVDSFSVGGESTFPTGVAFSTDGKKMFVIGDDGDSVHEYTLGTAFDVSTTVFVDSFSVGGESTIPTGVAFSTDGTKMFVVGFAGDAVYEYTLGTAFDVSTGNFTGSFSVAAQDNGPVDVAFSTDGTKMFVVGDDSDAVYEYIVSIGTCSPPSSGNWTVSSTCTMTADATIASGETWTINPGVILTINPGVHLTVDAGGTIDNSGTIEHLGTINSSGTLDINTGKTLNSSGAINNNSGGTITIEGILNNNNGSILNNNNGSILTNNAMLANNSGGVIINAGTIANNNLFNNNLEATIFNFETINNSAVHNNSGNIINCGTYTGNPPSGNILLSCIISENITITSDVTILSGVSLMVDSGVVLTINSGITLTIPSGQNIIIKDGSGVLIKSGGKLNIIS